ncbi:MAG TPA: hypothetical protein PK098_01405 [Phycisphaerales bacterium]|nr:hypothetical protein [Phycisphaerales bacterium]
MTMQANRFRRFERLLSLALLAGIVVTGCAPDVQARNSLRQGDPARAVRLFEQAVAQRPDDAELSRELTDARRAAGEAFALRSEDALKRGAYADAVRFAREASEFNPAHRTLESRMREAWCDHFLAQAETALADGWYEDARAIVEKAQTAAPGSAAPSHMLRRINDAEAAVLREHAITLTSAGAFDRAIPLARRAASLRPDDAHFAQLPVDVERTANEAAFDQMALGAQADLSAGRLEALASRLAHMAQLNVRRDQLLSLQNQRAERESHVQVAVERAREARGRGDFMEAIRQYDLAATLAVDRELIAEERQGAVTEQRADELYRRGLLAAEHGEYRNAISMLEESLALRATDETAARLALVRAAYHRTSHEQALTSGNMLDAIAHLSALSIVDPDDPALVRLDPLRRELVEHTLAEASRLHASGNTDAAIAAIDRAMTHSGDSRLMHRRADLAAERLIQQAIKAEQAGRFEQARRLYLQAMSQGGERQAIAARISDVEILAEMDRKVEVAHRDVSTMRTIIADRERDINSLQQNLTHKTRDFDDLVRTLRSMEYELAQAQNANHHLHATAQRLQYDVDLLRRDVDRYRRDADYWRRRYEDERRQPK